MNEKKKTLTVEDLAEVTGGLLRRGVADGSEEDGSTKYYETEYTERKSRAPDAFAPIAPISRL